MAYTVLARKYRPQTFAELVGQEHVARTLSNAIAQDRVAHAFLFTGVRGVGKTSTARLLAKALNCDQGPTAEPCNECDPCKEIAAGVDIDVLEIDGASNNSVDDVRRLQETLPYRPARDRFKIVIVDEVHMLSQGAFNAFLKTLEEPPAHVKFIFATTESHKVPITIRSRCQRYDFRLIPQAVVAKRVREILANEGIEADDGAVAMVAREAAGSMRDALTLLDQLVAFGGERLVGEEVAATLGIADRRHVLEAARAALEGDGAAALRTVDALAAQGADMLHFARQLLSLVRDLVVLRVAGDESDLVDLVPEERKAAQELASAADLHEMQRAFAALSRLVDDVARSAAPKTVLEMGLVRIATRPALRGVGELLDRLETLERRLGSGGGPGGNRPRRQRPPTGTATETGTATGTGTASETATGTASAAGTASASKTASKPPPNIPERQGATGVERSKAPRGSSGSPRWRGVGAGGSDMPAREASRRLATPLHQQDAPQHPETATATTHAPETAPNTPPNIPEDPATASDEATSPNPLPAWQQIVGVLRDQKPALAAIVEHASPLEVTAERLVLGFANAFYQRQAAATEAQESLAQVAAGVLGGAPKVQVRAVAPDAVAGSTVAQVEEQRREDERQRLRNQALSHPRVQDAMQIFPEGADHVRVRIDD